MAGRLAGWPGQVVRVRAVSRAGEPSRAQVTVGAGRPEMGRVSKEKCAGAVDDISQNFSQYSAFAAKHPNFWWSHRACLYIYL